MGKSVALRKEVVQSDARESVHRESSGEKQVLALVRGLVLADTRWGPGVVCTGFILEIGDGRNRQKRGRYESREREKVNRTKPGLHRRASNAP